MKLLNKLLLARGVVGIPYPRIFYGVLSNPTGGLTIGDGTGVCTIQSNPIIPNVSVSRTSGKAPLAVGFDASGTVSGLTTNPSQDLFYLWNFGDENGETWAYGANPGLTKNLAYGDQAAHVFKTSGTKTWNLTIMDGNGNVATTGGTITVSDWALSDTIYISNGATPVAGSNGVPIGATNLFPETTWAGVAARFAANKRIMLDRASTWACTATTVVPAGCQVDSYGAGTRATVTSAGATQTPFSLNNGQADVRIVGIRHVGPGAGVADSGMVAMTITDAPNLLMLNLESDQSTFGFLASVASSTNTFIQDCNFHDYGVTGISTNIAVYFTHAFGCYMLGSNFDGAPGHLVRISGSQNFVVDSCRFRRPELNNSAPFGHALTIRGIGDGTAVWPGQYTEKGVVTNLDIDTRGTSSTWSLQIAPQNTIVGERLRRILVERNLVLSDGVPLYSEVCTQLTVRGNVLGTTGADAGIILAAANTTGTPASTDARYYNNTVYKSGSGAFSAISLQDTVSGTQIKNMLAYAPSATAPALWSKGVSAGTPTASNNTSDAQMLSTQPWASGSPSALADFTPTAAYALNAGTSVPYFIDPYINTVTSTPDLGAIQV